MRIGQRGIDLIKEFEGLRLKAYLCPAGIWTIGYGTTKGVKSGMVVTQEGAEKLLANDLVVFENGVTASVKSNVTQNQFDALVCFAYNVGLGNFKSSTLLKKVNKNPSDPTIVDEFAKWKRAGGKVLDGLVRRRAKEAELYFDIE